MSTMQPDQPVATTEELVVDQTTINYQQITKSIFRHMTYIETIVSTTEIPDDAKEQALSRTMMWATQQEKMISNDYIAYAAVTMFKNVVQRLEREIELALGEEFRQTRQLILDGVKEAITKPTPGTAMDRLLQRTHRIQQRAGITEYAPNEITLTSEYTDENLDMVLGSKIEGLSPEQAALWFAHRVMLAPTVQDANEALHSYQAEVPELITQKIPPFTSIRLINARLDGVETWDKSLDKYRIAPQVYEPIVVPDQVLEHDPIPNHIKAKPMELESASPDELMAALSERYNIPVLSMEKWRQSGMSRAQPVIIKNFEFRSIGKPEFGRAQFMLMGPTPDCDIRLELKTQTVSGGASDRLPMTLYRLKKMSLEAPYQLTMVGITNTTFFAEDTLELAQLQTKGTNKMWFIKGKEVLQKLHAIIEMQQLWHSLGGGGYIPNSISPVTDNYAKPSAQTNVLSSREQPVQYNSTLKNNAPPNTNMIPATSTHTPASTNLGTTSITTSPAKVQPVIEKLDQATPAVSTPQPDMDDMFG